MRNFLLISNLRIQNANALSSPYTLGFPAMTAWLGATHALERQLRQNYPLFSSLHFPRTAVISHQFEPQIYRGKHDYVSSIIGTSNPLNSKGGRPSFVEEARCHLTVSLLIECENVDPDDDEELINAVSTLLNSKLRIAGGDVLDVKEITYLSVDENPHSPSYRQLIHALMPGYVLIERRDLLLKNMAETQQDILDSLLDLLAVHHQAEKKEETGTSANWRAFRKEPGWLVPIAVGFQAISEISAATENTRDMTTPHRFAEPIVTLGEFVMPYRITQLSKMFWQYQLDTEHALYLCQNQLSLEEGTHSHG